MNDFFLIILIRQRHTAIMAECHQTRHVLELLLEKGFYASILAKSDLVLHDLDLLQSMEKATVSISVAFNEE